MSGTQAHISEMPPMKRSAAVSPLLLPAPALRMDKKNEHGTPSTPRHLSLSLHTMFHDVLITDHKMRFGNELGYACVQYVRDSEESMVTPCNHFIYVIDTSASMCNGDRLGKAKAGFKASCAMLGARVQVTVICFESTAKVVYAGPNPYFLDTENSAAMQSVLDNMRSGGGTNILAAMKLTASEVKKNLGQSICVLLMTDGEDFELSNLISKESDKMETEWIDDVLVHMSGVQIHIVGISHDATPSNLSYLSEVTHGTLVCVKNKEIIDVMGALLGLVEEKIPEAMTLDVKIIANGVDYPLLKTRVPLIISKSSHIAFKIPALIEDCEHICIHAQLQVAFLGNKIDMPSSFSLIQEKEMKILKEARVKVEGDAMDDLQARPDCTCISEEARHLWGEYNRQIASNLRLLKNDGFSKNMELNQKLIVQMLDFKEYLFIMNPKHGAALREELDYYVTMLEEQAIGMKECIENRKQRILEEQRALSRASTQRNCSISLQSESRSMSSAQVHAIERIRSLSSSIIPEPVAGLGILAMSSDEESKD